MRSILLIFLLVCGVIPPVWGGTPDVRMGIEIDESLHTRNNYLDRGYTQLPGQMHFTKDTAFNLLSFYPSLSFSLAQGVEGYLQGDIHLEHHFDDEQEDETEADLTAAYLSFDNRRAGLDIGIQPVQFGKGRILTDEAPAIDVTLKAGDASFGLTAARVLDRSPVVGLTLGYVPGFLEHLSLFGVWFQDRDNAFAKSIPLFYQVLTEPESEGDLYWIGATADLFMGKALFSMVGAYQFGQVALFNANNRSRFDVAGYYGDFSLEVNLTSSWSAGAFCVLASGDSRPLRGDLNTFIGIQPFNPRAVIFFDPDFFDNDEEGRLTLGAGIMDGVISPGMTMSFSPTEDWRIDAVAATFYAHEALNDGSRWYGWEVDVDIQYTFGRRYTLYGQAARFWHGDYFDEFLDEANAPATRMVAGLRFMF